MFVTEIKVMGDHEHEYTIKFTVNGRVECDCKSFRFRGGLCKHMRYVIAQAAPAVV